jgi:predicted transcriptional regulator
MRKNLESNILQLVSEKPGIEAYEIRDKLNSTLNTICSYLKRMAKDNKIERRALSKHISQYSPRKIWSYHYFPK